MLARFVLGAVVAGAMIVPALAGDDERRRSPQVRSRQGFRLHLFRRHPRRRPDPRRHGGRGRGPVQRLGPDPPCALARQYASNSRPGRLRFASRACRSSLASISTSATIAASAARSRAWASPIAISITRAAAQMLMARAVARPRSLQRHEERRARPSTCRSIGAGRNAGGRKRQDRAGQVRAPSRKTESAPELRRSTD